MTWQLFHASANAANDATSLVKEGDILYNDDGVECTVTGWKEPYPSDNHSNTIVGARVYVKMAGLDGYTASFFPLILDLEFRWTEDANRSG